MSGPEIAPSNLLGLAIRHERPPPWAELHPTLPRALGPLFLPRWEGPGGAWDVAGSRGMGVLTITRYRAGIGRYPARNAFVCGVPARPGCAAIRRYSCRNRPESSRNVPKPFRSFLLFDTRPPEG